jgi:hypothetical protein
MWWSLLKRGEAPASILAGPFFTIRVVMAALFFA